ncbi:MAG: hypothetical protein PHQ66_03460 [Candidatus Nanoarchaeia archaeon]|nr:hypothetical protein [Candidatus Nanoarchaeia archaeon]MDD5357580.1 hypothetical protein [Candidatus Nanoarchaeia archaeon]MDD5588499.1 hypothetical protein [Candidatus Nanoarchaeia archaeon]
MNERWNRKAQVTIFIIIAIVIVAGALLVYSFFPQIQTTFGGGEVTPQTFIQTCIEKDIQNAVDKLSLQGGSITPENYLLYKDIPVEYLCYTNEYYATCNVQQPNLALHIESEIKNEINNVVDACFNSLQESYEGKGYSVDMKSGEKIIELLPKRIAATFDYSVTLTKGGDVQNYDSFIVLLNNNLYELTSIANSIVEWETTYGDAETSTYMTYYHDLKVEKILRDSGTKVYIITDRNTDSQFQFASRSQVWPAGYVKPTI